MNKQTAIQLLRETIDSEMKLGTKMVINWDMYLAMEREQIIEAHKQGQEFALLMNMPDSKEYYNETYKGGEQ